MKFDFCIGNPPYQEETSGDNETFAAPVYNKFMDAAYTVADKVELIHPARFLFNAGSTPKAWNAKMLEDEHFKVLEYEEDSSKIFPSAEIKAGVAISYRDAHKVFGAVNVFVKYPELNSILDKVSYRGEESSLSSIIYTQNRYDLDKVYKDYPELKNVIGSDGKDKRFRNNAFEKIFLFREEKKNKDDYSVMGVIKNKRCWRYLDSNYIDHNHENLDYWKVIVPRANGKGILSDVFSSPTVLPPKSGYTQTFIGVGAFDSESEAQNCLKYIKTKFARALLCVLKVDQHNEKDTWKFVPLQNFNNNSDINWDKSISEIDMQLYKKYGLSANDISFIEARVKEMV